MVDVSRSNTPHRLQIFAEMTFSTKLSIKLNAAIIIAVVILLTPSTGRLSHS
jgi:hypothetical protein